jgi:hypothetical protein
MPTNRKRRARNAQTLDTQHIEQLLTGLPLLAGTGFAEGVGGGGCNGWSATDWQTFRDAAADGWRRHGAAIMAGADDPAAIWAFREFGPPDGRASDDERQCND